MAKRQQRRRRTSGVEKESEERLKGEKRASAEGIESIRKSTKKRLGCERPRSVLAEVDVGHAATEGEKEPTRHPERKRRSNIHPQSHLDEALRGGVAQKSKRRSDVGRRWWKEARNPNLRISAERRPHRILEERQSDTRDIAI